MKKLENKFVNNDEQELAAIKTVWESAEYAGTSKFVPLYEQDLQDYFNVAHAAAVNNGTNAIEVAIRALGLQAGDEVMLPAYAPVMSIIPLLHTGMKPVFVDCEPMTFNLSLDDIVQKYTARTKAMLVVPMWGYPIAMSDLQTFCNEHDMALVEDAAHCHGSMLNGQCVGTLSTIGVFSTQERKLIATGEGGAVLTADEALHHKISAIRDFGKVQPGDTQYPNNIGEYGLYDGSNFRITGISAALGSVQLHKLEGKISTRTANASEILAGISSSPHYKELTNTDGTRNNYYSLVLILNGVNARQLGAFLAERNIISDTYRFKIRPLYDMPQFSAYTTNCVNTEQLLESIITIPTHEGLTAADKALIIDTLMEFSDQHIDTQ